MYLPFVCSRADLFLLCAIYTAKTLRTLNSVCVCLNVCLGARNLIFVFVHSVGNVCVFNKIARVTLGAYNIISAHTKYRSFRFPQNFVGNCHLMI